MSSHSAGVSTAASGAPPGKADTSSEKSDLGDAISFFRSSFQEAVEVVDGLRSKQQQCLQEVESFAIKLKERLATLERHAETNQTPLLQCAQVDSGPEPNTGTTSSVECKVLSQEVMSELQSEARIVPSASETEMEASKDQIAPASPGERRITPRASETETEINNDERTSDRSTVLPATPVAKLAERHTASVTKKSKSMFSTHSQIIQHHLGRSEVSEQISFARSLAKRRGFETVIGCIIFIHAIFLGVEAQQSLSGAPDPVLSNLEIVFLSIYVLELAFRLLAFGNMCWRDPWFVFDFLLVSMNVLLTISEMATIESSFVRSLQDQSQGLLVFRILRLLRFIRLLRQLPAFRQVWNLINGLFNSSSLVVSTLAVLGLTLYMFAIAGIEFIAKDSTLVQNPETSQIIQYQFGSLFRTMMALVQFVTLDSVAGFYYPLILAKPSLAIYFLAIFLVVSVSLMNMVTALLIDEASKIAKALNNEDTEILKARVSEAMPALVDAFQKLDAHGKGVITEDMIQEATLDMLPQAISVRGFQDLFDMLDIDGSGELTQEEFVDGLLHIYLLDVSVSNIQMLKLTRRTCLKVSDMESQLRTLGRRVELMAQNLHDSDYSFGRAMV